MKILMTGGDGFLGQYVSEKCRKHNIEFVSYDMASGKDILDRDAFVIECMANKPDVVIHAAAVADLYISEAEKDKNFSINVQGTYFIARICSTLEIPLVYISTCCAYGNVKAPNEQSRPIPTEAYAWSKLAGEDVLGCVGKLKALILRLGTFYGPGMRPALFNYAAIDKVYKGEPITIHGDGQQTRQYIHVADVARAVVSASKRVVCDLTSDLVGAPYVALNIIGQEAISVSETIAMASRLLDKPAVITYTPQRDGQIISQQIDGFYTRKFLGWEPKIDYASGMHGCVQWYLNKLQESQIV